MRIFFSVGEPSGDAHAAKLIHQLQKRDPRLQTVGYGGPKMEAAGCQILYQLTNKAVIGITRAVWNLVTFYRLAHQARRYFQKHKPDAVVLVDFPGFNFHIARFAKAAGIPVFWYCPPQVWAWAGWRIGKVRRYVDHVLCPLPFEQKFYEANGVNATLVGHPFFDEAPDHQPDKLLFATHQLRSGPLVTLLPGSRNQEVEANLPHLLQAGRLIQGRVRNVRLAVAALKEDHAQQARQLARQMRMDVEVRVGKTSELIELSHSCLAVSGSVSLELMHHQKPSVILYQINRRAYLLQWLFRRVKYITLVNLLASGELHPADLSLYDPNSPQAAHIPFPEYLTHEDRSQQLADHICQWLQQPETYKRVVQQLAELKAQYGGPGASQRAADSILGSLGVSLVQPASQNRPTRSRLEPSRPHFLPTEPSTTTSQTQA